MQNFQQIKTNGRPFHFQVSQLNISDAMGEVMSFHNGSIDAVSMDDASGNHHHRFSLLSVLSFCAVWIRPPGLSILNTLFLDWCS